MNNQTKAIAYPISVGPMMMNAVVISCPSSREAIIVDPGAEANIICQYLSKNSLKVVKVVLTHAHFDHCTAAAELMSLLRNQSLGPADDILYMHSMEKEMYAMLESQGSMFGLPSGKPYSKTAFIQHNDVIYYGHDKALQVIHAPGHSPGSLCYYDSQASFLVAGDVIFQSGIGRTDLWGGSYPQLMKSIRERILCLPGDTRIICGHGPETTVATEKSNNPFLV